MSDLPSSEEIQSREREYRQKIASTTSHELARKLLALPEARITFVGAVDGPYTQDLGLTSEPWHVDHLNQIRMHVGDTTGLAARRSE